MSSDTSWCMKVYKGMDDGLVERMDGRAEEEMMLSEWILRHNSSFGVRGEKATSTQHLSALDWARVHLFAYDFSFSFVRGSLC